MSKLRHFLAIGLPIAIAIILAVKPFVPPHYVGVYAVAQSAVSYLLESPLGKAEQPAVQP